MIRYYPFRRIQVEDEQAHVAKEFTIARAERITSAKNPERLDMLELSLKGEVSTFPYGIHGELLQRKFMDDRGIANNPRDLVGRKVLGYVGEKFVDWISPLGIESAL